MDKTREELAAFLHCSYDELCFTRNATESTSIIATGLRLQPGDEVIVSTESHPGGLFPWMSLQKTYGIVLCFFTPSPRFAQENVRRVSELITSKTRVIQVPQCLLVFFLLRSGCSMTPSAFIAAPLRTNDEMVLRASAHQHSPAGGSHFSCVGYPYARGIHRLCRTCQ